MLESIWFAALTGWASGIDSDLHINQIMRSATRLLLPNGDPEDFGKQGFMPVESG